jgi:CheY-like chemotaxis protein
MMNVLVIDDEKFVRNVFASELGQENISVTLAEDGEKGLKLAREKKPDVIVLDLILPKKDGFEVIGELRNIPELKHTLIYVFSGLAQEHDKQEALSLGVSAYFPKNQFTVHQVVDAIRARGGGFLSSK